MPASSICQLIFIKIKIIAYSFVTFRAAGIMRYLIRYPLPTKNTLFLLFTKIFRRPSQNSLSASFFLTFAALTARRSLRTTGTIVFYCGQMQSICSGKRAVKSQEKRRRHLRQVLGRRSVNEKKQYFSGSDTRTTIPRDTRAIYKLGEKND